MDLAALHQPAADEGVDRDMHEVAEPRAGTLDEFRQRRRGCVVFHEHRRLRPRREECRQVDRFPSAAKVVGKAEFLAPAAQEIGRSDADADNAGIAKPVDQLVEIGERRVAGLEHQIGIRKAVFVRLAGADLAGEVDQHGFQRAPADLDADAVDPLGRKPIEGGRRSALPKSFSHLLYESRRLQPIDNVGDRSRR